MSDAAGGWTLGDVVTDNAVRYPAADAYRMGGRRLTHAALRERAVKLISALVDVGVRRQDRIAVYSRNSLEFGEVLAATQLSGIILATVNFRWSPPEVLDALRRVRPGVIFVADEFAAVMAEVAPTLSWSPLIVCIGGRARPGMVDYEQFLASGREGEPTYRACSEDIACLLFTSGTTGASKCCIIGHREMRDVALAMNAEMRSGSLDLALVNMPMFHVGAMAIAAGLHARGGTVVLQRQFDVTEAIDLITDGGITVLHLAPVMLAALLDDLPECRTVDGVRTVVYAAAPMTATILARAMAKLPQAGFMNLYGQTEAIVSGLPPESHRVDDSAAASRLRSVGYPFPGVRVRIADDDGRDVPAGQPGEVVVQSDSMFRGYWDDTAATLATLRDGWCHTGDIGRLDETGLLYLVDRKKDVIISGGENVYSPEVEDAVCALPGIATCAVVGVPDDRWGEAVCAVVVPRAGTTVTLEAIQDGARGTLAGYKLPRRLVIADDLPVLASGKVDKKRLRAELAGNT